MTDTVFTDGQTKVVSAWLNDINVLAYRVCGSGGVVPTTVPELLANLGISTGYLQIADAATTYLTIADAEATYMTIAYAMANFLTSADLSGFLTSADLAPYATIVYADTKNIAEQVAPGAAGNVLTSNGTAWVSEAPGSGGGGIFSSVASVSATTGTVRHNTGMGPMMVTARCVNSDLSAASLSAIAYIGATSSPATVVDSVEASFGSGTITLSMTFMVPSGWYYKIDFSGATVDSVEWV